MMPAKANPRNHRNNPYVLDGLLPTRTTARLGSCGGSAPS
jgi:hypothetical protein